MQEPMKLDQKCCNACGTGVEAGVSQTAISSRSSGSQYQTKEQADHGTVTSRGLMQEVEQLPISCSEAEYLSAGLQSDDCRAREQAISRLVSCLKTPACWASSFKHGEKGIPDVIKIAYLVSSIADRGDCLQIMETLTEVWCTSQSCTLEQRRNKEVICVEENMEFNPFDFDLGPNSLIRAWFGPSSEEFTSNGIDVMEKVRAHTWDGGMRASTEFFGDPAPGQDKVLLLEVEVDTDEAAVVSSANNDASACLSSLIVEASEASACLSERAVWISASLAAAVPLLERSLPKDKLGVCMLPHQHSMTAVEADKINKQQRVLNGRRVWLTSKICDRCMDSIYDRVYYHCAENCDVDFCMTCHEELREVMTNFRKEAKDEEEVRFLSDKMMWAVHAVDEVAKQILHASSSERMHLAQLFASEWPDNFFGRLVDVVVDVCNAKLLFNCTSGALATCVMRIGAEYQMQTDPIYQSGAYQFWYTIALLQFLYETSGLLQQEEELDGHEARGHKVPIEKFILEGINKCSPRIEWDTWERVGNPISTMDILRTPSFSCSSSFRSLAAHNNLLPISFRRECLVEELYKVQSRKPLQLQITREQSEIVRDVCNVFSPKPDADLEEYSDESAGEPDAARKNKSNQDSACQFLRPLRVSFKNEAYRTGQAAAGPGVTREFFHVALQALLAEAFEPTIKRTFWFRDVLRPDVFFACGVLLGQVLFYKNMIPNIFPWPLYDMLLRDLGSPKASTIYSLQHLAAVSEEEAKSIGEVQTYEGSDIGEVYGSAGWERVPNLAGKLLTQATKAVFIQEYIQWSFQEKIQDSFKPMSDGFRAVLGQSKMIQRLVDAKQLERIVCGGEVPVDIAAIRKRATIQDWDGDEAYVESFWSVLANAPEAIKLKFVVFVTGSDRVPLRGWEELRVKIQRNGSDDDRLPTAYTCFSLVLLPQYSSIDVLEKQLHAALLESQGFGLL